ncbi:MAG: hypothetical protein VXW22_10735 [Pseudomonadota bacterium]|nr:hypothetical protein [Pseudomonadota bacterium]
MIRLTMAASAIALITACGQATEETDPITPETPPVEAEATETSALLMPLPEGTSAEIAAADLAQRIATLADDTFEGRGPASENGEKAADWIAAEMERVGLQPAGENGTWFQTVGMVEQTLDENASSLRFSGGASGEEFPMTLKEDAVLWTKKQDRDQAEWNESELVFVGYGVVAPEYGWDDYAGLDVEGKTSLLASS